MKILFAIKSLSVLGGGAERVLAEVANGLSDRGYEVSILTFDATGQSFYKLSPQVKRYDLAIGQADRPLAAGLLLLAIFRIRQAVAAVKPDMVIGFMHSIYVPLAMALLGSRIPFIASEHADTTHYKNRPIQRSLRRWAEGQAVLRTVPSETVRRDFLEQGDRDRLVVLNPVDMEPFAPAIGTLAEAPQMIVSVGRFSEHKDQAILLTAFAAVAEEFPNWRLRLVGDGVMRSVLEARRLSLGLDDKVDMPGFTRDVATAYAGARFVALPSRYESFGLVAAEALASGRPVLAFDDCAGLHEVVTDEVNGLLVAGVYDPGDRARAFAAGLRRLMADPALCIRLGAAGPQAVPRFNIGAVLDRWEEIISLAASSSPEKLHA